MNTQNSHGCGKNHLNNLFFSVKHQFSSSSFKRWSVTLVLPAGVDTN